MAQVNSQTESGKGIGPDRGGQDLSLSNAVKGFNIFYANISSFSAHAKSYLFSLPKTVGAIALVETHKNSDEIVGSFEANHFLHLQLHLSN